MPSFCGVVNRLIRQAIGLAILFPRDMFESDRFKGPEHLARPLVERFQMLVFHPILPFELPDHQLRIGPDFQFPRVDLLQSLKPQKNPLILGLVVGSFTQKTAELALLPLPLDLQGAHPP